MFLKFSIYFIIFLSILGIGTVLYFLYFACLDKCVRKYIYQEDDEELLPEEEKKRRYDERKREIINNQLATIKRDRDQPLNHEIRATFVGVVKPMGRFSKMIMGERLPFLSALMSMKSEKGRPRGFWQMLMQIRDRTPGRQQNRGR